MSRYLITGSTGGLGRAVRQALFQQGHDLTTMGRLGSGINIGVDFAVASPEDVCALITASAANNGPFDGIVHCAGAAVIAPLATHEMDDYARAFAAMHGAFGILMAAARRGVMREYSSIVLMSSVAAHRGVAAMAAYSAGKAAIEALTRAGAVELARRRIRVNAVAAGGFQSPMHDRVTRGMDERGRAAYADKHPLGIGTVDQVAKVILQLLEPGGWQTGSVVVVDGGFLAG
jgi:NAD(P)-dependent dehydrogenase (short-subunit alcohol dehydrogenase family)